MLRELSQNLWKENVDPVVGLAVIIVKNYKINYI